MTEQLTNKRKTNIREVMTRVTDVLLKGREQLADAESDIQQAIARKLLFLENPIARHVFTDNSGKVVTDWNPILEFERLSPIWKDQSDLHTAVSHFLTDAGMVDDGDAGYNYNSLNPGMTVITRPLANLPIVSIGEHTYQFGHRSYIVEDPSQLDYTVGTKGTTYQEIGLIDLGPEEAESW